MKKVIKENDSIIYSVYNTLLDIQKQLEDKNLVKNINYINKDFGSDYKLIRDNFSNLLNSLHFKLQKLFSL